MVPRNGPGLEKGTVDMRSFVRVFIIALGLFLPLLVAFAQSPAAGVEPDVKIFLAVDAAIADPQDLLTYTIWIDNVGPQTLSIQIVYVRRSWGSAIAASTARKILTSGSTPAAGDWAKATRRGRNSPKAMMKTRTKDRMSTVPFSRPGPLRGTMTAGVRSPPGGTQKRWGRSDLSLP